MKVYALDVVGVIPDELRNLTFLTNLNLGQNYLTGPLSASIGNLTRMQYLSMGINALSGELPKELGQLTDLRSFAFGTNNFSGSLPSELGNLVKLEQLDYDFAIKCGGPQITSSDQIVFERDDETLGPATYYVIATNRWAVSNIGLFSGSNNPQYTSTSSSQFTNTLDSELFHTARISAGSLRYYGLGLENGNYNFILQFAETAIVNSNSWKSLGRRVFDVYIQGDLILKDFDIRKEAGGVSFQAVKKEFRAQALENYIEIHLFWAGKGTCC
ncbi:probable LRR receptor-like serine/threonine-protein kinase At1g56140 [Vitis riparia]|uniref:probable LRR receptor-like serine/threonine-protein kinase At1g56140 n=1 Tax=Vitis riparia TaxID=96939 RepID=UPI00155A2041|nr:probable LRR receptor-like serine/threonine-protein kinase At1g56140 [Vitis riparia]